VIEFESVGKTYPGGTVAVENFSYTVPMHRTVVLVGSSGSGKTTLLRVVNRMVEPTSGRVLINGADVREADPVELRRSIGYVLQDGGLMPHRTVADNVATVPILNGTPRREARSAALELLERVGLDPKLGSRYPAQLSGGQRQRVGVARALAAEPEILLMDEPFGAVDPIVRRELQDELVRLQGEIGKTVVFVTHDVEEAFRLGDEVVVLGKGGQIAQSGTPESILAAPASDFVRTFIGGDKASQKLSVREVAGRRVVVAENGRQVGILDDAGFLQGELLESERTAGGRSPGVGQSQLGKMIRRVVRQSLDRAKSWLRSDRTGQIGQGGPERPSTTGRTVRSVRVIEPERPSAERAAVKRTTQRVAGEPPTVEGTADTRRTGETRKLPPVAHIGESQGELRPQKTSRTRRQEQSQKPAGTAQTEQPQAPTRQIVQPRAPIETGGTPVTSSARFPVESARTLESRGKHAIETSDEDVLKVDGERASKTSDESASAINVERASRINNRGAPKMNSRSAPRTDSRDAPKMNNERVSRTNGGNAIKPNDESTGEPHDPLAWANREVNRQTGRQSRYFGPGRGSEPFGGGSA
jgi:amino acid ABC transporter, ATP-binding protein